ncbi:putative rlpA-like protein, double-psi beta-barrel [Rosa chinensis]|uniref:Putative rlpA-like protein, double-psi beta-barrel n=1 Tax=Rosa chinensis TaxID=74649 RepID=A0A2P6SFK0_ROSCH|nr:putative rlpA-like protein, double-psi beta-barrel [Rosa chinensis]
MYPTYHCSPPVSKHTKAYLILDSFENGIDGGVSTCDNRYHSDETLVVALSTGWFNNGGMCLKNITNSGIMGAVWWPWWWIV